MKKNRQAGPFIEFCLVINTFWPGILFFASMIQPFTRDSTVMKHKFSLMIGITFHVILI